MNRRLLPKVLIALVLATLGTLALVVYVKSAKDKVISGEARVTVLVVNKALSKGSDAAAIRKAISPQEIPAKVRATNAVSDESEVTDSLVAAVDLQPGEQLLTSRLVAKAALTPEPPKGLVTVTVGLDPDRAGAGTLQKGDTVGVFLSFDPFDVGGVNPFGIDASGRPLPSSIVATTTPGDPTATTVPTKTATVTHLELHKVLVTAVQFDKDNTSTATTAPKSNAVAADKTVTTIAAPSGKILVTLALGAPQAEQLVFASEFGHVWLAGEPTDANEDGTGIVTLGGVYRTTGGQ